MSVNEGTWKAIPTTVEVRKSEKTGTKFVAVVLRVTDGPSKGDLIEWQGYLTDGTKARTIESLNHMGFDGDHLASCKNEVLIVVENEEFVTKDGAKKSRPRVRWVNDANWKGGFGKDLDAGELKDTLGELRALHLESRKAKPDAASFDFGNNVKEDDLAF